MFGIESKIYKWLTASIDVRLKQARSSRCKLDETSFDQWTIQIKRIHGEIEDESKFLIKELYFILILYFIYGYTRACKSKNPDKLATLRASALELHDRLKMEEPSFKVYSSILDECFEMEFAKKNSDGITPILEWLFNNTNEDKFLKTVVSTSDFISTFHADLFSKKEKHATGSHFTPIQLCNLMLEKIKPIDKKAHMLDPTCGTGAFLVALLEFIKKNADDDGLSIIKRINGYDIDPLAVLGARINLWLANEDFNLDIHELFNMVRVRDILHHETTSYHYETPDIIIGNPPWVTLKDLPNPKVKNVILKIAKELDIAPGPHHVPQIEFACVAFSYCLNQLLRPGGKIFFVMTSSFLNGKNCSKFREFRGCRSVEIWIFKGDSIFPKPFACLFAEKTQDDTPYFNKTSKIRSAEWQVKMDTNTNKITFEKTRVHHFTPANIVDLKMVRDVSSTVEVKRLVPINKVKFALPTRQPSVYKQSCYNGATIFPQALLFVRILEEFTKNGVKYVRITPEINLKNKKPWNFYPYEIRTVEKNYIFDLIKGSELFPFGTLEPWKIFLPVKITPDRLEFDHENLEAAVEPDGGQDSNCQAAIHYRNMNDLFQKVGNASKRIKNLWDRINFNNELTNPAMRKEYKVVFPDCGAVMAAAIVKKDCVVEHALHYIGVDDIHEALYLSGILNAPCLEKDMIEFTKAERHIGQLALDYSIPKFNPNDPIHLKIASLTQELMKIANDMVQDLILKEKMKNASKYYCVACEKFVNPKKVREHEINCTRLQRFEKIFHQRQAIIKVDEVNYHLIKIKPTKKKIKKFLLEDKRFSEILKSLDAIVKELLNE
ncbi:MAG: HsdM family class I SAM-dependent methyltransferase [Promethearchaeota archaeon]